MTKYINKSALVAEIDDMLKTKEQTSHLNNEAFNSGRWKALKKIKDFINTLEVKDANEALRTEYEKGRADVIADTLSWLDNCWPRYCSNQTIIEGFKEAIKE